MENVTSNKLTNKQMLGYAVGSISSGLIHFVYALYYVEFFYNDLRLLPAYFIIGQIIYAINVYQ